ncbi:MAG: hypothetical protein MO852_02415 [Candidatus Devosia euplotis]|nr:hypothetical protein [Candidatus Devosia euplotis]
MADWIDAQQPASAIQQLRLLVLKSAAADIVLDLHCNDDGLKHIFTSPKLMPGLQDLADWMGVAATLTAEDSGGDFFNEVPPRSCARPSWPIPATSSPRQPKRPHWNIAAGPTA